MIFFAKFSDFNMEYKNGFLSGEISFLRVNFENYGFKTKPKSEVSTHTDPIGVNNIKYLNQSESSNHDEEHQPIFDGYHRFLYFLICFQIFLNGFFFNINSYNGG